VATLTRIGRRRDDDEPRRIGFKLHAESEPDDGPQPQRPDPGREEGGLSLVAGDPARTRQFAEWFGLLCVVVAIGFLAGPAWALLVFGVAIVVSANAT
jgi:hypothetical protein